jgi:peptidase M23-like protein
MPRSTSPHAIGRPTPISAFAVALPMLLAGLFPLPQKTSDRWGWSGSWVYPVGDPYTFSAGPPQAGPQYYVVRSVRDRDSTGSRHHQGADISCGHGGGPVRAAGNGLVVNVGGKGWNHGYGRHVVLAHHFLDGTLVYSVYAHLAPGSVSVRTGQMVAAGRVLGRVGMTGRATSPHLHFEVRVPDDPSARWENAPVVDPLAFVAARRPPPRADTSWANRYLDWAECAALIRPGDDGSGPISRVEWWRALAAASKRTPDPMPSDAESLHVALVAAGLLPGSADGDHGAEMGWPEFSRDLRRARDLGMRLPWSPFKKTSRRRDCLRELGVASPARHPEALASGRVGRPSRAAVCLALADIAGDPPPPPKPPKPPTPKPADVPKPHAAPDSS